MATQKRVRILGDMPKIKERMPNEELFSTPERHKTFDVPASMINIALQVRPDEDFGNLTELVSSIRTLGIEQPIRVARWPLDTAKDYLGLNNRAYPEREPKDPDELVPLEDGTCLVVIYGHRRLIAGCAAQLEAIPTKISDNPSFREAVQVQTAENLHNRPSPVAFARGLNQVYKLGRASGMYPNKAVFARESGLSVEQARDALRFCELPANIQELVVQRHLSYATAVQLSRLIPAVSAHEKNQVYSRAEHEASEMVSIGAMSDEDVRIALSLIEVDETYLSLKIEAVLREHLLHIQRSKMSAKTAATYIGMQVRCLYGTHELPIMNDEARRDQEIDAARRRMKAVVQDCVRQVGIIATVAHVYAGFSPEIQAAIREQPVQRMYASSATQIELLADIAKNPDTKLAAYGASAALSSLVEIDAIPRDDQSLFADI